jgi:hypothetical protein
VDAGTLRASIHGRRVVDGNDVQEHHVGMIGFASGFVSMLHLVCHWSGMDSLRGPDDDPDPCFAMRRMSRPIILVSAGRLVSRFLLLCAVAFCIHIMLPSGRH